VIYFINKLKKGGRIMKRLIFLASVLFVIFFLTGFTYAQETGSITGKLLTKDGGATMGGGLVYFFVAETGAIPDPDKYWRVPDEIANIDENGEFTVKLHEGKYYMGAIKRSSGTEDVGPPLKGDLFFISYDEKGSPKVYHVKKNEEINLGTISEATPYKGWTMKDNITFIEGKILADGKPVEGAIVLGYISPKMIGKPDFVSERSDKDGKYILRVPEGSSYYLMARDVYGGGPPVDGSIMGVYGAKAVPGAVTVKKGESTKGIDIKVIMFPGRGPR
jgi:hypothetical protein